MDKLIEALRRAFTEEIVSPQRTAHQMTEDKSLLIMPAWRTGGRYGVKLTQVDAARRPSVAALYALFDGASGQPIALFDGAMLTSRRTAATSALAADYLARADAETFLMVGTGALASHLIEAHAAVRSLRRVLVWGRNPENADRVVADAVGAVDEVRVVEDLAGAVGAADIISCATGARTPVLYGSSLKPGAHVDLVGAFRPEMAEADADVFARGVVFVDTHAGAFEEAGDLIQAIAAGALAREDVKGDLAALCGAAVRGRSSAEEITVFKSVGVASEDLACAELVHEMAMQERASSSERP